METTQFWSEDPYKAVLDDACESPLQLAQDDLLEKYPLLADVYIRHHRGEKLADISRDYGVKPSAIRERYSQAKKFVANRMELHSQRLGQQREIVPFDRKQNDHVAERLCDLLFSESDGVVLRRGQIIWALRRARMAGESVYFIQSVNGGPIKIGRSTCVLERLKAMQTARPDTLVIVGLIDGDASLEAMIHRKFTEHRLQGEWFTPADEILSFIYEMSPETERLARGS